MRESQYQIPTSAGLHEGGTADTPEINTIEQQAVAAFFETKQHSEYTPEMHALVKNTELHIDAFRSEALNTPIVAPATIGGRMLEMLGAQRRTILPDMHTLIDQESLLGGRLFAEGSRFWLHPADTTGVRDWYFTFMHGEQEHTIHYQSDSSGVHKIYNGRRYAFTEGEAARFVDTAVTYEHQVYAQMYRIGGSSELPK